MQFGIFTVGDVTTDPMTGRTPTEAERINATVEIAKRPRRWAWTCSRPASTTTPVRPVVADDPARIRMTR
jgi:hypothetical protein